MKTFISSISRKEFPISEQVNGKTISKSIFDVILKEHLGFSKKNVISTSELAVYRQKYLAALQAPVIMMSQNRQGEKDRERAKQDDMVNLKAELEIRTLHEKVDHLIIHQQQELLNMQQVQVEMLEDILKQIDKKSLLAR